MLFGAETALLRLSEVSLLTPICIGRESFLPRLAFTRTRVLLVSSVRVTLEFKEGFQKCLTIQSRLNHLCRRFSR
jgi:hypothetical protein